MPPVNRTTKRRRAYYGELTQAILRTLLATGAVTLTAMLSSTRGARAIEILPHIASRTIRLALRRLKRLELVSMAERGSDTIITITKRGQQRALRANIDSLTIPTMRRWDRRWRIVLFDIPEEHRTARNTLQQKLRSLHLYRLQKSVYVTPYPCADAVEFLREVYGVRPFVRLIETTSLGEMEPAALAHFKLR